MTLRFPCSCGKPIEAPDKQAGKVLYCPYCGNLVHLPAGAGSVSASPAAPEEEDWTAPKREKEGPECPGCHRVLAPDTGICPGCGYNLRLGKPGEIPRAAGVLSAGEPSGTILPLAFGALLHPKTTFDLLLIRFSEGTLFLQALAFYVLTLAAVAWAGMYLEEKEMPRREQQHQKLVESLEHYRDYMDEKGEEFDYGGERKKLEAKKPKPKSFFDILIREVLEMFVLCAAIHPIALVLGGDGKFLGVVATLAFARSVAASAFVLLGLVLALGLGGLGQIFLVIAFLVWLLILNVIVVYSAYGMSMNKAAVVTFAASLLARYASNWLLGAPLL